jgi:hypothetical protein
MRLTVIAETSDIETSVTLVTEVERRTKEIEALSNDDLHKEMFAAHTHLHNREEWVLLYVQARCAERHKHMLTTVIPLCKEIIKRYKKQGVDKKFRPNGQPTVAEYFKSIGCNYDTVRQWISRAKNKMSPSNRTLDRPPKKPSPQRELFPKPSWENLGLRKEDLIEVYGSAEQAVEGVEREVWRAFARFIAVCDSFRYRGGPEFDLGQQLDGLRLEFDRQIEAWAHSSDWFCTCTNCD